MNIVVFLLYLGIITLCVLSVRLEKGRRCRHNSNKQKQVSSEMTDKPNIVELNIKKRA